MKNSDCGLISRAFRTFLAGQGILSFGESARFIAVTILMHDIAGSGIPAAAGVALSALPGILASPFAGVIGDRSGEGRLLVLLDILRSLAVLLFLFAGNIAQIYLLIVLISISDVFYNPSRQKYVLEVIGKRGVFRANSLLTGASGAAYLAGPMLSGFLTDKYGPAPSILLSSVCCLISAALTFSSAMVWKMKNRSSGKPLSRESALSSLSNGIRYCRNIPAIRGLLSAGFVLGFCTISVNLAFYPFAFDALRVDAKRWSMMITTYYGANLLAMVFAGQMDGSPGRRSGRTLYRCLAAVSLIWLLYAATRKFAVVLLLQFAEGTALAACGIILAARLQTAADKEYMARAAALNDMMAGAGKLAGMGVTSLIIGKRSFTDVFIFCGILLLMFAISGCTGQGRDMSRKPDCSADQ
jgi:MFS family permease